MAHSLDYLGWLAWLAGDDPAARRFVAESRAPGREVGLKDESGGEGLAVLLARSAGDHAGALARLLILRGRVRTGAAEVDITRGIHPEVVL